ncbi:MAG TPA: hypothetical protein VFK52_01815 [Nocardioidaceae bacterium]|nr:hypothetical protein [Nocardioidaceae bacterium]
MTTRCPSWWTLEHGGSGPAWDFAEDGALFRAHGGPRFGHISVRALDFNDGRQSVVEADLDHDPAGRGSLSARQLRQLARDALAAAEWIETSRPTGWTS